MRPQQGGNEKNGINMIDLGKIDDIVNRLSESLPPGVTRLKEDPQLGRSKALTQAQLQILESARRPGREGLSHPIFWGAFTLVGDGARPMTVF